MRRRGKCRENHNLATCLEEHRFNRASVLMCCDRWWTVNTLVTLWLHSLENSTIIPQIALESIHRQACWLVLRCDSQRKDLPANTWRSFMVASCKSGSCLSPWSDVGSSRSAENLVSKVPRPFPQVLKPRFSGYIGLLMLISWAERWHVNADL